MSTITKLDPMHRARRSARRATLRSLERVLPTLPFMNLMVASWTYAQLDGARKNPALHGNDKQAIFDRYLKALTEAA